MNNDIKEHIEDLITRHKQILKSIYYRVSRVEQAKDETEKQYDLLTMYHLKQVETSISQDIANILSELKELGYTDEYDCS